MTTEKSTPITLTDWQSRAWLAGRLSLLFVPIKDQPPVLREGVTWKARQLDSGKWELSAESGDSRAFLIYECPYPPGSRIWGREKIHLGTCSNSARHGMAGYSDGGSKLHPESQPGSEWWCRAWGTIQADEMPEWASRFSFTVVSAAPMQVKDVSEQDARLTGINGGCLKCGNEEPCGCDTPTPDCRDSFIGDWMLRHGSRHPWESAWAWRIELESK